MDRQSPIQSPPPNRLARAVARGKRHRHIVILLRLLMVVGLVGATAIWRRASADVVTSTATAPGAVSLLQTTTVNPQTVSVGGQAAITTTISASAGSVSNGIIDIEVYDANNTKVGQQFISGQKIGLNQPATETYYWRSTASGTYRIAVGVFTSNWSSLLFWANKTATVVVDDGPTSTEVPPTSTEVPPTSTAVPPTSTAVRPTSTAVPPTSTAVRPTSTAVPPSSTAVRPTSTAVRPSSTAVPPTSTAVRPTSTAVPPTSTAVPPTSTPVSTPNTVLHQTTSVSGSTQATITTTVSDTSGSLVNGIIDIEVYNTANQMMNQQFFSGQTLSTGQSMTHTVHWTAITAGTYRVQVGVYGTNWTPTLLSNSNAASITVNGPTATPIPPTSTPVPPTATTVPATSTSVPNTSGCGFQSATQPVQVAFCDTFNAPAGTGNRSGDLNGTVWGVSRVTSAVPQGQFYEWYPTQQQLCGGSNVFPNQDVRICNGQLVDAVFDGHGQTVLAMYPKQPFDIAGRTGTATFDLGNTTQGFHTATPEWWYTDQPVPAPYSQASGLAMFPRNGLGVQLGYVCTSNNSPVGVSVSDINVFVNYASPGVTLVRDGCVKQPTTPTQLNHFEIRLSQSSVQVWGTDAGTTAPLVLLAHADNLGLTMTRGLIWLLDQHYNACKFNNQCDHAFVWDNVGFDGPRIARDLTFDVPDAKIMQSDGGMQLGWQTPSDQNNPLALTIPGVTNVAQAKAALLVLNWYPLGTDSISYSLNGAPWQTQAWPFPDTISWSSRTLAIPVPLSDVHTGNNTLRLATSDGASVANIDLVLAGAGG